MHICWVRVVWRKDEPGKKRYYRAANIMREIELRSLLFRVAPPQFRNKQVSVHYYQTFNANVFGNLYSDGTRS